MGAAASAFGEDDFSDIEEWVNASDVMNFFADELDGGFIRYQGDVDAFSWGDFFANGFGARSAFFKTAVSTTLAAVITLIAVVVSASVVSAAGCEIAFFRFAELLFRACGFGARPGGTECKLVEKAF